MSQQQPPPEDFDRPPTEEELRAYGEQLRRIRVEDVIAGTLGPLLNVGTLRAGLVPGHESEIDLDQLRKAIEAARALMPFIEADLGPQLEEVRGAVSNLQMAYARLVGQAPESAGAGERAEPAAPGAAPGAAPAGEQAPPPAEEEGKPGEPGPAQRSGRLWIPGQ
jgi:hypothetical protein